MEITGDEKMLNRVVLVGRLTKDPDLRYTTTGKAVANFTIAVNRQFTNQQGDREADFINCVIWNKPAESLANYMSKGSLIGVDGNLQTRTFDGQDGKRVYVTEVLAGSVQFLESKDRKSASNQQNTSNANQQNTRNNQQSTQQNESPPFDLSDDDLPF